VAGLRISASCRDFSHSLRIDGRLAFGVPRQTTRPGARPAVTLGEERKGAGCPAALLALVIRVLLQSSVDPSSVDQRQRVAQLPYGARAGWKPHLLRA
jgi:hypothetical protein